MNRDRPGRHQHRGEEEENTLHRERQEQPPPLTVSRAAEEGEAGEEEGGEEEGEEGGACQCEIGLLRGEPGEDGDEDEGVPAGTKTLSAQYHTVTATAAIHARRNTMFSGAVTGYWLWFGLVHY